MHSLVLGIVLEGLYASHRQAIKCLVTWWLRGLAAGDGTLHTILCRVNVPEPEKMLPLST